MYIFDQEAMGFLITLPLLRFRFSLILHLDHVHFLDALLLVLLFQASFCVIRRRDLNGRACVLFRMGLQNLLMGIIRLEARIG